MCIDRTLTPHVISRRFPLIHESFSNILPSRRLRYLLFFEAQEKSLFCTSHLNSEMPLCLNNVDVLRRLLRSVKSTKSESTLYPVTVSFKFLLYFSEACLLFWLQFENVRANSSFRFFNLEVTPHFSKKLASYCFIFWNICQGRSIKTQVSLKTFYLTILDFHTSFTFNVFSMQGYILLPTSLFQFFFGLWLQGCSKCFLVSRSVRENSRRSLI